MARLGSGRGGEGRMLEKLQQWLAFKLPKQLVYWSAIRVLAHATCGAYSATVVPELTAMEALRRWEA